MGEKCRGKSARSKSRPRGIELQPHQEKVGVFVGVLIHMQDVAVVAEDKIGEWRRPDRDGPGK